jgi:hypothetical protein
VTAGVNLGGRRPDRAAAILEERDAYAEQLDRAAAGFPTYEVPAFVAERFPGFRPEDPGTWPEPDRCTDGRPWGHDAYSPGGTLGANLDYRWQRYLAAADAVASSPAGRVPRWTQRDLGCRNRWRDEESRLCGTHVKQWREAIEHARKRLRRNARELEHLDLAKQLAAYGIEADGFSDSVRLQADAVRGLLQLLAERST